MTIGGVAFRPSPLRVRLGTVVSWTNNDPIAHTSTGDGVDACCPKGPALWNSGALPPSGLFFFAFDVAGTFAYHCSIHPSMRGVVASRMSSSPEAGTTATTFAISWATRAGVPDGDNMDIQIQRPGASWADWRLDQTGSSIKDAFVPDGGPGLYRFRARLQKGAASGGASDWSPSLSISVS